MPSYSDIRDFSLSESLGKSSKESVVSSVSAAGAPVNPGHGQTREHSHDHDHQAVPSDPARRHRRVGL